MKLEAEKAIEMAGLKLRKAKIQPESSLYVSIYHTACALNGMKKYHLCTLICNALLSELEEQTD